MMTTNTLPTSAPFQSVLYVQDSPPPCFPFMAMLVVKIVNIPPRLLDEIGTMSFIYDTKIMCSPCIPRSLYVVSIRCYIITG